MQNSREDLARIGKVHRVYVAAPMDEVETIVSGRFEGFTMYAEVGQFQRGREEMVVVEIATDDTDSVVELCRSLRKHFNQDGVGLAVDGTYYRVTR